MMEFVGEVLLTLMKHYVSSSALVSEEVPCGRPADIYTMYVHPASQFPLHP
jgi:hypothetical protein